MKFRTRPGVTVNRNHDGDVWIGGGQSAYIPRALFDTLFEPVHETEPEPFQVGDVVKADAEAIFLQGFEKGPAPATPAPLLKRGDRVRVRGGEDGAIVAGPNRHGVYCYETAEGFYRIASGENLTPIPAEKWVPAKGWYRWTDSEGQIFVIEAFAKLEKLDGSDERAPASPPDHHRG